MYRKYGLDFYKVSLRDIEVMRIFQKNEIYCFHIKKLENGCSFGARIKDREKIKKILPQVKYEYTSGIWGMILRNITNKYHLISYVFCILLWSLFSQTVFHFTISGENDTLEKNMYQTLNTYLYKPKNIKEIKESLLHKYKNDISWLEVYDKGSIVNVRYSLKKYINNIEKTNEPLIAKKDGMIAYFECDNGYKVKNVNDLVYKGDILVDNKMSDSYNRLLEVNVSGKVFAYTWQKVIVEMKKNSLPDAINYFSLLLEARNQIHITLEEGERVEKENVLHFEKNEGTIKLIILYTLLEDITS